MIVTLANDLFEKGLEKEKELCAVWGDTDQTSFPGQLTKDGQELWSSELLQLIQGE